MRPPSRFQGWPSVCAVLLPLLGAGNSVLGAAEVGPNIHIQDPDLAFLLERAVVMAGQRLESPRCQGVLRDFKDRAGDSLQIALDRTERTAAAYVRGVEFYGASSAPRCQGSSILAFTKPGSRVVFVCPEQFTKTARNDTLMAEITIIHEALHTLGLGENPPSPAQITAHVLKSCR